MKTMEDYMEDYLREGCIECDECGLRIEIDTESCPECDWKNPVASLI